MTDDEADTTDSLIAAVAKIPERNAPQAIGRYKILRALGAGGMGVVYEAEDPELSRKVAIKLLHERSGAPKGATTDRATRLKREAQTLAKLMHPHVVTVFDVGTHDGELYIVMQLVDGTTLDRHVAGKSVDEIVAAFVDAGRGLVAAHAQGIVHRDFKPANVLVGRDGTVRVSDFGLASSGTAAIPADATALTTAVGVGTPAYMAPEQFTAGEITTASDQFAFCVALWEALYGERPFGGSTYTELSSAVTRGDRRKPPDRRVPRRVRAALLRGLATEPRDRFPSLTALLAELSPRRRRIAIYAIAAAVVIAGIGFAALRGSTDACDAVATRDWTPALIAAAARGSVEDVRAVARFVDQWPELRREACRRGGATDRQALCLDAATGKLERALARPPWRTARWGDVRPELPALTRCAEADPDRTPIVTPILTRRTIGAPPTGYALGPDGRVAVATPRMIEILSPTGAHATSVSSPHLEPSDLLYWASDGIWFQHTASLEILDPTNGATRKNRGLPAWTIAISRDGSRVLAGTERKWSIVILDSRSELTVAPRRGWGSAEWSPDDRRIAVVAIWREGATWNTLLSIVDVATRTVVDNPIRLDHGVAEGLELAWLDNDRVALNGRARLDAGEGLWVATLDDTGHAIEWEERLPASTGSAYVLRPGVRSRALAELDTSSDRLIRIRDGVVTVISETIDAIPQSGVQLSRDASRISIASPRGRGWFSLATGAFFPIDRVSTERAAIDHDDRVLTIAGNTLYATDGSGTRSIERLDEHAVRCDPTGRACFVFRYVGLKTRIRSLDNNVVVEVDGTAYDVAIASDGRIAATRTPNSVIVVDPKTDARETWLAGNLNCKWAHPQYVAWTPAGDALYVSSVCGLGRSRVSRLAPGVAAKTVYEGPWVGAFAVTEDGDVLTIRRQTESQPVLIEGL